METIAEVFVVDPLSFIAQEATKHSGMLSWCVFETSH
jgi:hypothetical protein